MSNIINKEIVLKLNDWWAPVGKANVADTFTDLITGVVKAVDIHYVVKEDGTPDFDNVEWMVAKTWEEWQEAEILPWHETIHTCKFEVRVPTVVIAVNCKKMPKKTFKKTPSLKAVFFRDKGKCQYTGKKLDLENASMDHVHPRGRGGAHVWTNVLLADKEVNRQKGDKLNSEAGLKPLSKPVKPPDIDICLTIQEARHRDWNHFLIKTK